MLRIAVVEDNAEDAVLLEHNLRSFFESQRLFTQIEVFGALAPFQIHFERQYDLIFLDIELPDGNGMDAAREIREKDTDVQLLFVTNLAQYAVKGYEVEAAGYLLKPVTEAALFLTLRRIVKKLKKPERLLVIHTNDGTVQLPSQDLLFVEIYKHHIAYHAAGGYYESYGTLKEIGDLLPPEEFYRCGGSYIVNFRAVRQISGSALILSSGDEIPLSRGKKKDFMEQFHSFCLKNTTAGTLS